MSQLCIHLPLLWTNTDWYENKRHNIVQSGFVAADAATAGFFRHAHSLRLHEPEGSVVRPCFQPRLSACFWGKHVSVLRFFAKNQAEGLVTTNFRFEVWLHNFDDFYMSSADTTPAWAQLKGTTSLKAARLTATTQYLVIQSDLFGMVKWPFKGFSDLQLGDQQATVNHLVQHVYFPRNKVKT